MYQLHDITVLSASIYMTFGGLGIGQNCWLDIALKVILLLLIMLYLNRYPLEDKQRIKEIR